MNNKNNYIVNAYNRSPLVITRGRGVFLIDEEGKNYLDFAAGISTASLGHCHPYIIEKLTKQMNSLWHCSNLFTISEQQRLAERLSSLTFADKVFFCSSGTESIEAAIKFIRRYYYMLGEKNRYKIITLEDGFHGRTMGAISAGGNEASREGFTPLLQGFDRVPKNDIQALNNAITEETAAVLLEPIQSEGGVYPLNIDYLRQVRELTRSKNILLCYDEVQSGYGRIGNLFYYQSINVEPDILTCAKAMGNGFPLAACIVKNFIADSITPGSHGSTYGGNPLAMVVGNAVLDLILQEGLFEHILDMSQYLKAKLSSLARAFPDLIVEVRGEGLLLGIEVKISAHKIFAQCLEKGLIVTKISNDRVIRITPPLIIEIGHINHAVNIIYEVLDSAAL